MRQALQITDSVSARPPAAQSIAQHAKRLYPLQVSPKDTLEWGYRKLDDGGNDGSDGGWVVADKSVLDGVDAKGLERRVGFEGTADPSTGYYCFYNEGRLVSGGGDSDLPGGVAVSTKPRKQM